MAETQPFKGRFEVFSTCPQSEHSTPQLYLRELAQVAQWSEELGCTGILVYSDNRLADPWLVAQEILRSTRELSPLIAVQPAYMHPYAAAKMVASLAFLHGRRVYLNMIAGGFAGDFNALNDPTPHDERYQRLTEYTQIISRLLAGTAPASFEGRHYVIRNLRMKPSLPAELMPGIFISGSSDAGRAAAEATGALGIAYPPPLETALPEGRAPSCGGVRLGIIARPDGEEAWALARQRFPDDSRGVFTHKLAMAVSDSAWHKQLSREADKAEGGPSPYWLWPFQSSKTFCPYLVGSYEQVAAYLAGYARMGYGTFILDIPTAREDLESARAVFRLAAEALAGAEGVIAE